MRYRKAHTRGAYRVRWDAYDLAAYSYVWNLPENASSGDGLGQAITYAVASTFCEDLLPQFSEKSKILPFLVNCQLLRAALAARRPELLPLRWRALGAGSPRLAPGFA